MWGAKQEERVMGGGGEEGESESAQSSEVDFIIQYTVAAVAAVVERVSSRCLREQLRTPTFFSTTLTSGTGLHKTCGPRGHLSSESWTRGQRHSLLFAGA